MPVEGLVQGWRVECQGVGVNDHTRKENTSGSSRVIDKFVSSVEFFGSWHHHNGFDDLDVVDEVGIEKEKP